MKPSSWNAPEPTTVSSATLFHCCAAFPGGSAAARGAAAKPTTAAIAAATRASLAHVFIRCLLRESSNAGSPLSDLEGIRHLAYVEAVRSASGTAASPAAAAALH